MTQPKTKRIMAQLGSFSKKVSVALAVNLQSRLIDDTPKDTGWASLNWVPNIGSPFRGLAGTPESLDTSVQANGLNTLMNWNGEEVAYISNNVPYIQALNAGHSKKAPALFVEKAIQLEVRAAKSKKGESI